MRTEPFILMGPPRAGSTLLAHTLNVHPQILCTDEARPFLAAHRALRPLKSRQDYETTFRKGLEPALRDAILAFYSEQRLRMKKPVPFEGEDRLIWGDKFPHYCDPGWGKGILEVIELLFPGTKYIFLSRDKIPCVESIKKVNANHNWLKKQPEDIYDDIQREGDRWEKIVGPGRFLRINYEQPLLDRCEAAVKFLDIPWNADLADKIHKESNPDTRTRYSTPTSW